MKEFIEGFDFPGMAPDGGCIKGGVPAGLEARALTEPGKAYAVYLRTADKGPAAERRVDLSLDMPSGSYRTEWINPLTGKSEKTEEVQHPGGPRTMSSPAFRDEIALSVKRTGG